MLLVGIYLTSNTKSKTVLQVIQCLYDGISAYRIYRTPDGSLWLVGQMIRTPDGSLCWAGQLICKTLFS